MQIGPILKATRRDPAAQACYYYIKEYSVGTTSTTPCCMYFQHRGVNVLKITPRLSRDSSLQHMYADGVTARLRRLACYSPSRVAENKRDNKARLEMTLSTRPRKKPRIAELPYRAARCGCLQTFTSQSIHCPAALAVLRFPGARRTLYKR
ncbi:hypothetical protein LY78DRAFT_183203 [Colletotrichum sublineola]|nr:hypothetical protein LY78DRAFT_183203 [Colletotrichum sublineola]